MKKYKNYHPSFSFAVKKTSVTKLYENLMLQTNFFGFHSNLREIFSKLAFWPVGRLYEVCQETVIIDTFKFYF